MDRFKIKKDVDWLFREEGQTFRLVVIDDESDEIYYVALGGHTPEMYGWVKFSFPEHLLYNGSFIAVWNRAHEMFNEKYMIYLEMLDLNDVRYWSGKYEGYIAPDDTIIVSMPNYNMKKVEHLSRIKTKW